MTKPFHKLFQDEVFKRGIMKEVKQKLSLPDYSDQELYEIANGNDIDQINLLLASKKYAAKVLQLVNEKQDRALDEYSQKEGSKMIHSKDYIPMNCFICHKNMPTIHDTHNPAPITPKCYAKEAQENNLPHRCCSFCDQYFVIPARMGCLEEQMEKYKEIIK
tara:strand:- start:14 stop:499 length:486 start_codon:yes stop_codon:yes gene_type:complete